MVAVALPSSTLKTLQNSNAGDLRHCLSFLLAVLRNQKPQEKREDKKCS